MDAVEPVEADASAPRAEAVSARDQRREEGADRLVVQPVLPRGIILSRRDHPFTQGEWGGTLRQGWALGFS